MPINTIITSTFPDRFTMPLGMEDRRILSGHLRASSSYNYNHGPDRARLNIVNGHGRTGAWVAKYRNHNQWLQIDLRGLSIVKGIATQGRREAHQWVTKYQMSYSRYGARYRTYVSYGRVKVSRRHIDPIPTLISICRYSQPTQNEFLFRRQLQNAIPCSFPLS